jgi:UDP-glucose 4-epimerase
LTKFKKKNVLVTGGSSYIWSHITKNYNKKYNFIYLINKTKIKNVKISNLVTTYSIFKKVKSIDSIIHLAGADDFYKKSISNHKLDTFIKKVSIKFNVNKIIFTSSNRVYEGVNKKIIDENVLCKPISPYGKNKLNTEKLIKSLPSKSVILRLPSVISKKFSKGLIFRILNDIKKNKEVEIFNPNSLFNNIISADELIKIIFYSLDNIDNKNLIINISANSPIKFIKVVKFLLRKGKSLAQFKVIHTIDNSKYYSTKLQNKFFKNKISSVKKSLAKLFT